MNALLDNFPADDFDEPDAPWFIEPKDKDPASELDRQSRFLAALRSQAPSIDAVAIPNAGKRSDWERVQRWREGARRGALDLVLTWNHGVAFLEFKDGQKMPSPAQRERLNRLYAQGHRCGVVRTSECALRLMREWGAPFLNLTPQPKE